MKFYFIVDILILIVLFSVVLRGWKNGLVSSVIRLVGTVAAYAGAWMFSGPISGTLYTSLLEKRLVGYAETLVPADLQKLADGFQAIEGGSDLLGSLGISDEVTRMVAEQLNGILNQLGMDNLPFHFFDTEKQSGEITGLVLDKGATIAEAITQSLLQPLATAALRVVVFAIIFWLLTLLVGVLYRVGFGFNHLPLVGGFNRLLGAGIGLLEGAIVVYILCMVLAIASTLLGSKVGVLSWQQLQQATLFRSIVGVSLPGGFGML